MISETEAINEWFARATFENRTLDFEEALLEATIAALGKSQIDAEAYIERNTRRHWNAFLEKQDLDILHGRTPIYQIVDATNRKILWKPGHIGLVSDSKTKISLARVAARPNILKVIDSLSDRQYEALGCVAGHLCGATESFLTPKTNEGGIDFFALIRTHSCSHIFNGLHRPLRIIGQSKMFEKRVQVEWVKNFAKTIDQVRNLSPVVSKLIPPWFQESNGPIIGWLLAHKGVQSGGLTLAKNEGIIISESVDIAELAAVSRKIDISKSANDRSLIFHDMVLDYLKRFG
jgi:hypothetical protein